MPFRERRARFVIAGTPRSGTTWLSSALNTHPEIHCAGELLDDPHLHDHPDFAADPWAGLQELFNEPPRGKSVVGFKLFYFHCWDYYQEHRGIWDTLSAERDLRTIFLTRDNLLRLVLSWETARQSGQWVLEKDAPSAEVKPCTLEPPQLMRRFDEIQNGIRRLRAFFANHPSVSLTYEDLFDEPNRSLSEIQALLGVTSRRLSGSQQKQETRTLRQAIANYDEVAAHLRGTPFARFLEDR